MVEGAAAVGEFDPEFLVFLGGVDPKQRDPVFLQKAATVLAVNEIHSEFDLIGIEVADLALSTTCFIALLSTWAQPFGGAR